MRRIIVIVTAGLVVLVAAASAYAALNTYTAKLIFTTKQAGTAAKPVPIGYTQNLTAKGTNGNRSAVLLNITTKIYGLKANVAGLPVCSLNTIKNAKTDAGCPKGARLASGYITAGIGGKTNFTAAGAACDPSLDVWNGGAGKLSYFFVETPAHQCLGGALKTGSVGPYPGRVIQQGKYQVTDVPIPNFVDFPLPGVAGSLETEHLVWVKSAKTTSGKTQAVLTSIGCQGGKRPYATSFTANLPTAGPAKETKVVTGSAPC